MAKRKVYLVDDHAVLRQGLAQLINHQSDLAVCGEAQDAAKALTGVLSLRPDVVVVDISLKGSNGLELIKNLKVQRPDLPILVVTMHDESMYAELALDAGAQGYINKEEAIEVVLVGIRRVLKGEVMVSDEVASKMLTRRMHPRPESSLVERLTSRELEVFQLLGQWKSARQIARELNLSLRTVEFYRDKIKEKLNLRTASALVQFAVKWRDEHSG